MQVRVIGAHLPRLDQASLSAFINHSVSSFRTTLRDLRNRGISQAIDQEIDERADEISRELDADLQRCALFEVEVTQNSTVFDPSDFINSENGSVGWEPAFISMGGDTIVAEGYKASASLREFRVAFYLHEWSEAGRLVGPTGELFLPEFTPVPPRLWNLAPYTCVD